MDGRTGQGGKDLIAMRFRPSCFFGERTRPSLCRQCAKGQASARARAWLPEVEEKLPSVHSGKLRPCTVEKRTTRALSSKSGPSRAA